MTDRQHTQSERGFTIIEALVAVLLLVVALAGPLSIAGQGLALANFARQQVTANFLAQETVEYIRNVRDNNILNEADWLMGLEDCDSTVVERLCTVDIPLENVVECPGQACPVIRYHTLSGQYGYSNTSGWEDTIFTREIYLEEVIPNAEVRVNVTMFWQTGLTSKSFTVSEHLFNWGS
ncbi:prepilin-type N-terminal cleavage/methylation domain-containing protein [Candidatus Wolfebacteria bacterium]|nr:prepilin-type N-terminal cleavage/methylation domain-containing protein [Candidatus Wolfebacteria bacterium]